jgi:ABC-type amino acid transport system permease subunit
METETEPKGAGYRRWLAHDLIVGAASGAVVGFVGVLLVSPRFESGSLVGVGILTLSVAIGVSALRWERARRTGVGLVTILVWLTLVLTVGFLTVVVVALRDFG